MKNPFRQIIFGILLLIIISCSPRDNSVSENSIHNNLDSTIILPHEINGQLFFQSFDITKAMYGDNRRIDSLYLLMRKMPVDTMSENEKVSIEHFKLTVNQKLHLSKKITVRIDSSTYFLFLKPKDIHFFEHLNYDSLVKNKKVIVIKALAHDTYYFHEKALICDSIISVNEGPGQTYNDKDNTPE